MKKHIFIILLFCLPFMAVGQDNENRDNPYWTEIVTSQPEGYVVLENGDVEISSAEGLAWLISVVNGLNGCGADDFEGRKVDLLRDLDLSGADWVPIGDIFSDSTLVFKGQFDGKGHTIKNLYIKDLSWDYLSLFGYLNHAEIHNIFLDQGLICGRSYCGGIAGRCDNGSLIDNCVVNLEVAGNCYTGGITGRNKDSMIRNCCYIYFRFEPGGFYGGGIAGWNEAEGQDAVIENCYYDSQIIGSFNTCWAGGIVGYNVVTEGEGAALVKNCYAALHGRDWYEEGGIVGWNLNGTVTNSYYCVIYNYISDVPVIGYGDMNYSDCSIFEYQEGMESILEHPVSVGEYQTDNLLDALNLWLTIQSPTIQYHEWCEDESLPFFCDQLDETEEHVTQLNGVTLFPNPSSGLVQIEGFDEAEVIVYNNLGQKVRAFRNANEINLEGLPQGIYTLRITDECSFVVTKKVIKK